jgi:hypothetical protein
MEITEKEAQDCNGDLCLNSEHAEHCKGYEYKVVRSVGPKLTRKFLIDEEKFLQDKFGVGPLNMRLKICKCNKCHEEFMLLKIDCGTYSHEQIYLSKLP